MPNEFPEGAHACAEASALGKQEQWARPIGLVMQTDTPVATGIEAMVCQLIAERQAKGRTKYGCTVADNPLTLRQWLQHGLEEGLDQCVYLMRAIVEIDAQQPDADRAKAAEDLAALRLRTAVSLTVQLRTVEKERDILAKRVHDQRAEIVRLEQARASSRTQRYCMDCGGAVTSSCQSSTPSDCRMFPAKEAT